MEKHNTQLSSDGQVMTDKQIRDVVTPYEFGVSEQVVGIPLARPVRRGVALIIDLTLVVMLTHLPSILLAGLGAVFFWRAGKKKNASPRYSWLRKTMKLIAAIILFGILVAVIEGVNSSKSPTFNIGDSDESTVTGTQAIAMAATMIKMSAQLNQLDDDIAQQRCEAYDCWETFTETLPEAIRDIQVSGNITDELVDKLEPRMQKTLTPAQTASLLAALKRELMQSQHSVAPLTTVDENAPESKEAVKPSGSIATNDNGDPSLLAWARGMLEDLGIGFGWAALYFTALTYWMHGQTPGKVLMKIKVIKLDGTTMTLWESFERYGGYGAGLATGLLGFVQIFWEPNRQAIHDKISETLVIRLGLNRVDVTAIHAYQQECRKRAT